MNYHNTEQTKQKHTEGWGKQETERTNNISHQKAWCSTSLSYSTMTPTNSTFEVHCLMWCPFPPHLWQICLGHCKVKWFLSLQTKHLLSFGVRRLERYACCPVTLTRHPSQQALSRALFGDMVIIGDSSFALRSPIAVLNSSREETVDPPSLLPAGGSSMLSVVVCRSLGS